MDKNTHKDITVTKPAAEIDKVDKNAQVVKINKPFI